MKKILTFILFLSFGFSYNIKQFVTCKKVEKLTPIEITSIFTISDKKVYAFAYFTDIKQNRLIDFVWEKNVNGIWKIYADIQLPIYAGVRWRTYSNITIRPFFIGKWRVSIVDEGNIIDTREFEIVEKNLTSQ